MVLSKKLNFIAILFVVFILFATMGGCKRDITTGALTIKMVDAPALFSALNVDITACEVHYAGSGKENDGWITLPVRAGVYDLLELQNNVSLVLVDNRSLPTGRIDQLRIMLGDNNTIVNDGVDYKLIVTDQTGIKINVDTEVKFHMRLEIELDFDAQHSVIHMNGAYVLSPVIKVKSVMQY